MNKEAFLKVVNNVKEISDNDLENLLESSKFYPYCQSIHILIAKKYHDLQHGLAPAKLHKAAIYSPDRLFLKRIMEDDTSIRKFTRATAVIPEIEQEQDPQLTDINNDIEEKISIDSFVETRSEEEKEEFSTISENYEENEVKEKAEHKEEAYEHTATSDHPQPSINNLTQDPEVSKNEHIANKEDIHAELQRNIKEYKEKRLHESQQTNQIAEAVKSEEPVLVENTTSAESTSVFETSRDTETSEFLQSTDPSIKEDLKPEEQTPLDETNEAAIPSEKTIDQHLLIENFIKLNPSLSRFDLKFDEDQKQIEDLSIPKLTIGEHLISENLAVILHKQGKVQKAINIYEKLILKFPEKKAYFASCIEKIKNPS